jgi:hypothetical protein
MLLRVFKVQGSSRRQGKLCCCGFTENNLDACSLRVKDAASDFQYSVSNRTYREYLMTRTVDPKPIAALELRCCFLGSHTFCLSLSLNGQVELLLVARDSLVLLK